MSDTQLAILTGASGAVGKATARLFAENGWSLVLCDRNEDVEQLAASLTEEFGRTCLGLSIALVRVARPPTRGSLIPCLSAFLSPTTREMGRLRASRMCVFLREPANATPRSRIQPGSDLPAISCVSPG